MQIHDRICSLICGLFLLNAHSNSLNCDNENVSRDIAKHPLIESLLGLRTTALEKILVETTGLDVYNLMGKVVVRC